MLLDISDTILFLLQGGRNHEQALLRCQGYRPNSIVKWKRQTGLGWKTTFKILKGLKVFDSSKIRAVIRDVVAKNAALFARENLFIMSFGGEGKSGGMICYEFRHSELVDTSYFKSSAEIVRLPPNSTIVFVDDLIGTGTQSLEHITDKLNLILSPSHNAILFTICATPEGIKKITDNSNFKVLTGVELTEKEYQHYSAQSQYFSKDEKDKLIMLNSALKDPRKFDYDRGLLIAFYYSVPNNSMPIIWKDDYLYIARNGSEKHWFALIPRRIPVVPTE